ncbi:capsid protein [Crucivirus-468]|nr:capsid protein [Crucivirus-468]
MATRYSRRLYSNRRATGSSRYYRFPRKYGYTSRGYRGYRGYGSYSAIARAAAPYALRAAPYLYRGYKAYRSGGTSGLKRYAGSLATSAAKTAIRAVTGYGAYSKVGKGGMQGTQAPSIRNGAAENGSIIVSHKEFVKDIKSNSVTAGNFNSDTFRLNPGDDSTFPWLSQISQNFQQYQWQGLCFHFKSMSADALNSTNTALGTIIMATQYDATQPLPSTKQEMENTEFAQSVKPSANATHFVECDKQQSVLSELYVNQNPAAQSGDRRFYDFGNFTIATEGSQALNTNFGELWVSYQVKLFKPQLWDGLGRDVSSFHWGSNNGPNDVASATPFGSQDWTDQTITKSYYASTNDIECVFKNGTTFLMAASNFPKTYLIQYGCVGTTRVWAEGNFSLTNCTVNQNSLLQTNASYIGVITTPKVGDNTETIQIQKIVNVDKSNLGKNWGIDWSGTPPTLPTVITYAYLNIIELPYTQYPVA